MTIINNYIPTPVLEPNVIHLWFSFPDQIYNASLLSAYMDLLSKDEREKQQRFHFPKHRHLYLVSHALIRVALSGYIGVDPVKIFFSRNDYGRPEIVLKNTQTPLRFNLSHTDGLIVCAIVIKEDIGVDVERIDRGENYMELARRCFSNREMSDLNMIDDGYKKERFFEYWTLKESFTKANGMGLYMPLEQFSFHISDFDSIYISFDPGLSENRKKWQFYLIKPTPDFRTALSVSKSFNEKTRIDINTVEK